MNGGARTRPPLSRSLYAKAVGVLSVPVVALLVGGAAWVFAERDRVQANADLNQSLVVHDLAQEALLLLVDAETGLRGYLDTGQKEFLDPYRNAVAVFPKTALALTRAETDNQRETEAIRADGTAVMQDFGRLADAPPREPLAQSAALRRTKASMDAIRAEVNDLLGAEHREIADRSRRRDRAVDRARLAEVVGVLGGVAGGLVGAFLFAQQIGARLRRVEEDAMRLASGEPVESSIGGRDELSQLSETLVAVSGLLRAREREITAAQERIERLASDADDFFITRVTFLPEFKWEYFSPGVESVTGHPPEAYYTDPTLAGRLVDPDHVGVLAEHVTGEHSDRSSLVRLRRDDATHRWLEVRSAPIRNEYDVIVGAEMIAHDVTERVRSQEELERRSLYDERTGLVNRALFADRLALALSDRDRGADPPVVLFIDLDNFKNVNDALGHQVGDRALQEATARLVRAVREHDTLARLGGDEFAVLCQAPVDLTEALRVAERVRAALDEPFPLDGLELGLSCSVGVKMADANNDASAVLRDADAALNRAKSSGRNSVHLFDDALAGGALARLELESDLRAAIPRRQLHLVFQPEIRLADERMVAVETLVRWTHPGRGPVSPAEFIPLAEETGLIGDLGRWVVEGAVRQAAAWCVRFGDDAPMVSINISGVQFDDPSFVPELAALLDEVGVPPAKICAEITETTLITDPETALAQAVGLRELGVRLAIDDFGTGYSSLAYLRRYPLDYLKVDQSFVRGLGVHDGDEAVVRAVTDLAHALGLEVIAEGVETADQRDRLREIGCGLAQGWLYSRGVLPDEIDARLAASAVLASGGE